MATRKKKETVAPAKVTKAATLRTKDVAALQAEVKELQKAHFGLRMQKATQQLSNTSTLRVTRRDIARAKTILAQKQQETQAAK
jgi:large subunit ribosomal protein L29